MDKHPQLHLTKKNKNLIYDKKNRLLSSMRFSV